MPAIRNNANCTYRIALNVMESRNGQSLMSMSYTRTTNPLREELHSVSKDRQSITFIL